MPSGVPEAVGRRASIQEDGVFLRYGQDRLGGPPPEGAVHAAQEENQRCKEDQKAVSIAEPHLSQLGKEGQGHTCIGRGI